MPDITHRMKHAWNAFMNRDPPKPYYYQPQTDVGRGYSQRPDRPKLTKGNERSIVAPIYNKIALDCAAIQLMHIKVDKNGKFLDQVDSNLNECLSFAPNIDQTPREFIQDVVLSLFDEGCVAIVPVETDDDPFKLNSYDIFSMRVGKIVQWYPRDVRINVYDDRTGVHRDILLHKKDVAIIENPFYAVMNEPSSTVKRLISTLNLSDTIDQQNGSGKLDLIIQLPYVIKTQARKEQAEKRRKDIEMQLASSKYGIAYTDGTEHITQLNRGIENNLNSRVEYLQKLLYTQLGITEEIMNGTASEETMANYYSRTIEPILAVIADAMKRAWLTKNARTRGQTITFFRNPFKLIAISAIADIADKFTRNEILSPNEIRQIVGMKPVTDAQADQLRNRNINSEKDQDFADASSDVSDDSYENNEENIQNGI